MVWEYHLAGCVIFLVGTLYVKAEIKVTCNPGAKYRTYDGSCNNLDNPTWGQAGTAQRRFLDWKGRPMVDYADGLDIPRGGIPTKLPSPRDVSNKLSDASMGFGQQHDRRRTGQHMAFGQLMAHDFIKTDIKTGIYCCNKTELKRYQTNVCFPFNVPLYDNTFASGCKNFIRAEKATKDHDLPAYREQINLITSYIDASFLYGSSDSEAEALRKENSFLLKTNPDGLLPEYPRGKGPCDKQNPQYERCPLAGDTRVHEVPNLALNHMLWLKQHNLLANKLHELNPHWDNERVFQETRRIIIAMVQHITYNHYLPVLLDRETMNKYGLYSAKNGYHDAYDKSLDASVRNAFGAAPFRYGHSQIMPTQCLLKENYRDMNVTLIETNYNYPALLLADHGVNCPDYARWLVFTRSMKINNFLVPNARDRLFQNSHPPGDDLFSLNIQRGRDQGVPAYNRWRMLCGLLPRKFYHFGKYGKTLRSLYRSPDRIDFFIGGLLERGKQGRIGPTFACILAKQFDYLKRGDRYWYERPGETFSFTEDQLKAIKEGALMSKMFCRAFELKKIQRNVFTRPHNTRALIDCEKLPDIELVHWKENNTTQS